MASSYVNDLRLNEMATGDASGTWGDTTNTNLELIAEAFSYGTEAITTNADTHTTTIADGATDPGRSMFLKYTGTLDSTCTITIGPNTVSKLWIIENGTSGSQSIIIKQGSGATITIPSGKTKVIYSDGAGSGGAMFDAFASLNLQTSGIIETSASIQTGLIEFTDGDDAMTIADGGGVTFAQTATFSDDIIIGDGKTIGSASDVDAMTIASNGQVTFTQTLIGTALDISGDIDVDGTTNLDVVDIDGAVDMASTLAVAGDANFDSGTLFVDVSANSVGIGNGTTEPTATLDVRRADVSGKIAEFHQSAGFGLEFGSSQAQAYIEAGSNQTLLITVPSDMTIDSGGDINLDSDSGYIYLKDDGTSIGLFKLTSSDFYIKSVVSDKDMIFQGNDGGSAITALTLDMSAAGAATFNSTITADLAHFIEGSSGAATTSGSANNLVLENSGNAGLTIATPADGIASIFYSDPNSNAAGYVQYNHSTNLHTIFSTGDINLDADGGDIFFADGGTTFGKFSNASSSLQIKSEVQDKDIIFKGNDGGSVITALTLDMSEAGAASFNGAVKIPGFISHVGDDNSFFGFPGGDEYRLELGGVERISMNGTESVFNEDGEDRDFRVESDAHTHAIFMNAANGTVGFGAATPQTSYNFIGAGGIYINNGNQPSGDFMSIDAEGTSGNTQMTFYRYDSSAGAFQSRLSIAGETAETVFNDSGLDVNFRVESDGNANMLFVDGGNDEVGVGTSVPRRTFDVNGISALGSGVNAVTIGADNGSALTHIGNNSAPSSSLSAGGTLDITTCAGNNGFGEMMIGNSTSGGFAKVVFGYNMQPHIVVQNGTEFESIAYGGSVTASKIALSWNNTGSILRVQTGASKTATINGFMQTISTP